VESEVEVHVPDVIHDANDQPLSIERTITEDEFAGLVKDLIQRTFKVCDEALQNAGMVARDLGGVILVGGPTRLPMIRNAVHDYFQQDPQDGVDPDLVVAMGAAIHANSLASNVQGAHLLDVTPLSLRVGVAGGLAEPVIERNTPIPIEQMRTFTTFRDHQESVKIKIYQGESRRSDENELLGQFEFAGFKKARRGEVQIDITFEINADGIVNVTAQDRETGQQASTTITLSSGLSEGAIQDIMDDTRMERIETVETDEQGDALAPPPEDPRLGAVMIGAVALKKVSAVDLHQARMQQLEENELETLPDDGAITVLDSNPDLKSIENLDGAPDDPVPTGASETLASSDAPPDLGNETDLDVSALVETDPRIANPEDTDTESGDLFDASGLDLTGSLADDDENRN
jgi:molecular chaperone DnaK (HSP70)